MIQVYCNNCGELLSLESEGTLRQPCPICGSMSRKFDNYTNGSLKPSGHTMAGHIRDEQLIGFSEGKRSDLTRYASLEPDGSIRLNLQGLAPRNEQDSDEVCQILVDALNSESSQVSLKGRGRQDEDHILEIDGTQIGVQVVRALTNPQFWIQLARSGEVSELRLSISETISALKIAIEHKSSIPPTHRNRLILALDAYRLPALTLGPVTSQFKKEYGAWASSLGFHAVYLVGPLVNFVSRLDR